MLIEIHAIQNHSPANLNRDDLGAPKTCYFGGSLRSRISSQCLKRSIRMSDEFKLLLGSRRTRRLALELAGGDEASEQFTKAVNILRICGIAPKEQKKKKGDDENDTEKDEDKSAGLVFVSQEAITGMKQLLENGKNKKDADLAMEFAKLIAEKTFAPDMALCGRMLEPKKPSKGKKDKAEPEEEKDNKANDPWKGLDLTVEAALQVAHVISTHEARPEVDYYTAADDVPGKDAGAGFVGEAMFSSACFYKYFSINWETLVANLKGNEKLAAHTVGAFIRGAALANPTGKQNSSAAHNRPDGILIEIKDSPVSYANAFANPVPSKGERGMVEQSIAQLSQYVNDMDAGYGKPKERLWFSPNLRHKLTFLEEKKEMLLTKNNFKSLDDELVPALIKAVGYDWKEVQKSIVNPEVA